MEIAKILIVDDDKNILTTLRKALDSPEYEISVAETGQQANDLLVNNRYDCVLLDLRLPDLDGLELLRRHNPRNVIMITAHGTIENAVEAMKLGCVDYLRKPFDLDMVRDLVRQVLERGSVSLELEIKYDTLIQQAKLEVQARHFRAGLDKVKQALEIRPDSADAYNILGVLHEILDEIPLAVKAYQTALSLDPRSEDARDNLARMRNLDSTVGWKLRF